MIPHDASVAAEECDRLIEELETVRRQLAPLRAAFDGGTSSAAEHERAVRKAQIKEQIRAAWPADLRPPSDADLETRARAHSDHVALHRDLSEKRRIKETLEARVVILEHQIGLRRAVIYSVGRQAGVQ
jgi:hypothetical protein